jgi:hypothetical protein
LCTQTRDSRHRVHRIQGGIAYHGGRTLHKGIFGVSPFLQQCSLWLTCALYRSQIRTRSTALIIHLANGRMTSITGSVVRGLKHVRCLSKHEWHSPLFLINSHFRFKANDLRPSAYGPCACALSSGPHSCNGNPIRWEVWPGRSPQSRKEAGQGGREAD